nr:unnamed protein product [Digitaria exilis]
MATCSPLRVDSAGFKDAIDESCWTPFQLPRRLPSPERAEYILSKLVSEQEILCYNAGEKPARVRGGHGPHHGVPGVRLVACDPERAQARPFGALRMLQRLMGSVPLVHVDDVWDALVFCMERPSMAGLFLCAAAYLTVTDIIDHSSKGLRPI